MSERESHIVSQQRGKMSAFINNEHYVNFSLSLNFTDDNSKVIALCTLKLNKHRHEGELDCNSANVIRCDFS